MIYIYKENHIKEEGIQEILSITEATLKFNKKKFKISPNIIPNKKNIIIDEFASPYVQQKLIKIKKNTLRQNII